MSCLHSSYEKHKEPLAVAWYGTWICSNGLRCHRSLFWISSKKHKPDKAWRGSELSPESVLKRIRALLDKLAFQPFPIMRAKTSAQKSPDRVRMQRLSWDRHHKRMLGDSMFLHNLHFSKHVTHRYTLCLMHPVAVSLQNETFNATNYHDATDNLPEQAVALSHG